jgi:gluconokinase
MIIIVMGVSGAGKTRIGELLAERLACTFVDGDTFHSAANKQKMAHGIALTDQDRWPWLAAIRAAIEVNLHLGETAVFGCSSLKRAYRTVLRGGTCTDDIRFVYLQGSSDLLRDRIAARTGHFFDPSLLRNQLDTLEEPGEEEALRVSIELTPDAIVDRVLEILKDKRSGQGRDRV